MSIGKKVQNDTNNVACFRKMCYTIQRYFVDHERAYLVTVNRLCTAKLAGS